MGRFDRDSTEARDLPALLTAAEEFRASIEREVRSILETAEARALEIERQADFSARQREQLSEHRAQQIVESVFNRASRVLDSIDLVESALSGMLGALRAELQSLAPNAPQGAATDVLKEGGQPETPLEHESSLQPEPEELLPAPQQEPSPEAGTGGERGPGSGAEEAPGTEEAPSAEQAPSAEPSPERSDVGEAPSAEPPPERSDVGEAPSAEPPPETDAKEAPGGSALAEEEQALQEWLAEEERSRERGAAGPDEHLDHQEHPFQGPVPLNPEAHVGSSPESSAGFDQMVRQQLTKMLASGKSREEAENFLNRFHFGGNYLVALDEIYGEAGSEHPHRRGGFFGRLRRRDR